MLYVCDHLALTTLLSLPLCVSTLIGDDDGPPELMTPPRRRSMRPTAIHWRRNLPDGTLSDGSLGPDDQEFVDAGVKESDEDEFILSVDGVHCRFNEKNDPRYRKNPKYFSHKFRQAGLAYEVALDLYKSQVAWINGPFPASVKDDVIFKSALMGKLPYGKKVIADHGYKGLEDYISRHSSLDSDAVRCFKKQALARQESFNKRLKDFGILSSRFRHGEAKFKIAFQMCVVLVQCAMDCGEPLFDTLVEDCEPDWVIVDDEEGSASDDSTINGWFAVEENEDEDTSSEG